MIPVYIVTGFIGAGKSTFINKQLQYRKKLGGTACISAEEGTVSLIKEGLQLNPDRLSAITPNEPHTYSSIANEIASYIDKVKPKEIWIEWNGMISFHQLEALLYSDKLRHLLQIEKVLYLCTDQFVASILPGLGNDVTSQLYSADCIITETDTHHALLRTYNSDAKIVTAPAPEKVAELCRNSMWGLIPNLLVIGITAYILLVTAFRHDIPYSIHQCFAIITGLIIEAIPFLLLGTIGSTVIRYFVPQRILLKLLGNHSWKSYGAAMVSGLALPVCDCAIIPLFKALTDRGVPLSVAILFMLASPIINPITILSTWYAFPDNPMISVWRIILGLGVALLIALSFRFIPPSTSMMKAKTAQNLSYEEIVLEASKSKHINKRRLLIHMEKEFSQLLFYFSIAACVLSVVQVYGKPWLINAGITLPDVWAIPILLLLAFFFSVCSTSDAIIGKSLSTLFPMSSVMGFLILGPMLDIKNVYILKQYMPTSFILRLGLTIVVISYLAALGFQFFLS